MKKIYIKTTESCQLRCKHCYIGDNRDKYNFFNHGQTIKYLQKYINNFNINESDILFSFHGGEPFLCPLDLMQLLINSFPRATCDATTNLCFELTQDKIQFIKQNFIDKYDTKKVFLKTSWDYKIRFDQKEQFQLWQKNIDLLIKEQITFKVVICLTSLLISELDPEKLLGFLLYLGINWIDFERLTENTTIDKSLIPDYNQQNQWLLDFYNIVNNEIRVGMFDELKETIQNNNYHIGCRTRRCMQDVITINADGTIGGCPNTAIKQYYTNIFQDPMDFNNQKRQRLIRCEQQKNLMCYSCDIYDICNGDCHQLSWQNNICPAPKQLIRKIKNDVERAKTIS